MKRKYRTLLFMLALLFVLVLLSRVTMTPSQWAATSMSSSLSPYMALLLSKVSSENAGGLKLDTPGVSIGQHSCLAIPVTVPVDGLGQSTAVLLITHRSICSLNDGFLITDILRFYDRLVEQIDALASSTTTKNYNRIVLVVEGCTNPTTRFFPQQRGIGEDVNALHLFLMHKELQRRYQDRISTWLTIPSGIMSTAIDTSLSPSITYISPQQWINSLSLNFSKACTTLDNVDFTSFATSEVGKQLQSRTQTPKQNRNSLAPRCNAVLFSRKYNADCMPLVPPLLPVLVTGLGSSGTHVVNNVLRLLGVDVLHERLGGVHGSVSWPYAVNDLLGDIEYPHKANLKQDYDRHRSIFNPRFKRVVMIARCPMRQISSLTAHHDLSFKFIHRYLNLTAHQFSGIEDIFKRPVIADRPHHDCNRNSQCNLLFATVAYLAWNAFVLSYADAVYHIERIEDLVTDVCSFIIAQFPYERNQKCTSFLSKDAAKQRHMIARLVNTSSVMNIQATERSDGGNKNFLFSTDATFQRRDSEKMGLSFSSTKHKRHAEYRFADVVRIDRRLADTLKDFAAQRMGYPDVENC